MSIVEDFQRAHIERKMRFAQAAMRFLQQKLPPVLPEPVVVAAPFQHFSRHILDDDYHRAWSIAIMDFDPREQWPCPRIEQIQKAVCDHYAISITEMLSARRTKPLMRPRMVAVYLCRQLTRKSLPEIGRRFGGRDHSTALHSFRKISAESQSDEVLRASLEMLTHKLGGSLA